MNSSTQSQQEQSFFVASSGNDGWSGTLAEPNAEATDGPCVSLEGARDKIRFLRTRPGWVPQPVTIWLCAGDILLTQSFALDARDSGTQEAPLIIRSCIGAKARLLGGRQVTNFQPVSSPAIQQRLDASARAHVLEADLAALGIMDMGRFSARGMGRATMTAHLELFFNDQPMTVARWPNQDTGDGFVRIAGWPEAGRQDDEHGRDIGNLQNGFYYEGDRPARWANLDNVWLHGYWVWDWANSYEQVESIDTSAHLITTRPPHGRWGYRTGNRFYFLNVLEELDSPGEYYVDRHTGMLYFWPPGDVTVSEVLVSILEAPLVVLHNASHVTLQDITFEAGRGMGVQIDGGDHVMVSGCTLRHLGNHAVVIEGGQSHAVQGCDIYGTGDGGVFVTGGDRATLRPCDHVVANNHIHHLSRWSRCYTPAISGTGVGIHMAHNHIHDLPHSAIIFWGNEMCIEFNDIHTVMLETADAGAIYTGRDYSARGNLIRYNYIHDTGGYDWGTMGVYLDDCTSGQTIFGNVFARVQRAVFIGGGCDNTVDNNIFIDCKPAVWVDARGLDQREVWRNMVNRTMKERLEAMHHLQPPYSTQYPALASLDAYFAANAGVPPENNVIARNICSGGHWVESSWHKEAASYFTFIDNFTDGDPLFVDARANDYRLQPDSPAYATGFKPIPFENIGRVSL